jgi:magnesium-transporting ATPase (P-type)
MAKLHFDGLTKDQAKELFLKHGPNALPESKPPSNWDIFLEQVKSPLVYVLIAAGVVTLLLDHMEDAIIIFAAVVLNAAL